MDANLEGMTDESLAGLISGRDESAAALSLAHDGFAVIYRRHAKWLASFLISRVGRNDLDDVQQVIWQRVWERLPASFTGGKLQVWIFYIARNYIIDLSRRQKLELIGEKDAQIADRRSSHPALLLDEQERSAMLTASLSRLNRQAAEVVERRLNGESYEEICEQMAIPRARAYKLLQQAKTLLTDSMLRACA